MPSDTSAIKPWTDELDNLAFDRNRCPRPGEKLLTLYRAAQHLVRYRNGDDLMDAILVDTVAVLDARCGAIALADSDELLHVRAQVGESNGRPRFSQKLAVRSYMTCKSILCGCANDNSKLLTAQTVARGASASVMSVLLRTSHGRLGVLQLGRNLGQMPFNSDDLHFADSIAVYLSLGIENAPMNRNVLEDEE